MKSTGIRKAALGEQLLKSQFGKKLQIANDRNNDPDDFKVSRINNDNWKIFVK